MGVSVRDVIREKGTPYEELGLSDPALSDDQLLDAMMEHPILINRPIVISPLGVRLCRPSEAVLDILPTKQQGAFSKEDGEVVIDAAGSAGRYNASAISRSRGRQPRRSRREPVGYQR